MFSVMGRIIYTVTIFLMVYSENLLNFLRNANVCFSDYAFPYIILVLSLVTLAVYMSASEIEVRKMLSSVRDFWGIDG